MRIVEHGIVCSGQPGGSRAIATFPGIAVVPGGQILATYRMGPMKDSDHSVTEVRLSSDMGRTWSDAWSPFSASFAGVRGSLQVAYLTTLGSEILACTLWVDRETYPNQPLFNVETEGCLPMKILVANSADQGRTFSPWREVAVTEDVGPPSLTNPVLQLPSGRLAVSIETNKPYHDRSPWQQRVVYCYSSDDGQTWTRPQTVCEDPTASIFHWDQRAAVSPNGLLAAFSWTYDKPNNRYLPIRRHISQDEGLTWTTDELDFADQPSHPAVLPDGRAVLAWVDRYGSRSIRVRQAAGLDQSFDPRTELTLYTAPAPAAQTAGTGEMLADMGLWSFGLPYAEALPDGDVIVVYYAGTSDCMDVRYARIAL